MFSPLEKYIPTDRNWRELQIRGKTSSFSQIIVATIFIFLHAKALDPILTYSSLFVVLISSFLRFRLCSKMTEATLNNFSKALVILILQSSSWATFIFANIIANDPTGFCQVLGYIVMAGIMTGATQSLSTSVLLFRVYMVMITMPAHLLMINWLVLGGRSSPEVANVYLFIIFLYGQSKTHVKQWEQMISTEQDLQTIINNFPGAISLVRKGKYVHANQRVAEISGLMLDQIVDHPVGNNKPDEEIPKLIAELESSADQDMLIKEVSLKSRQGSKEHLVFLNRLKNKDIVVISLDVSSQRSIERELEKQKIRAQSSAKMAALGEMSSGLAHEINNPLAIISAKAQRVKQLLRKGNANPEELIAQTDSISDTVKRIAKIVKGLRQFARDGEKDPFASTSISVIINDTLTFCETRFKNHEIELRKKGFDHDILIDCRSVQISQVLLNVLNNAHDAIEKLDEKWIELELQETENEIRILVTDSGPGIPIELRDKLMQPFFTTKDIGKGTGLGLSLSKGLIEDHSGKFYFDFSSPKTRVVIELPKKQAAASTTAA